MRLVAGLAALVLVQPPVSTVDTATRETKHLRVVLSASAEHAAPGDRVSLYLDVTPKAKMHVYAPGQHDYVTVSLKIEPASSYTAAAPKFPPPQKLYFEPLQEEQLVYSKPFRITSDLTLGRERIDRPAVTVKATLRYQACDDHVCYLPTNVPIEWTIAVRNK